MIALTLLLRYWQYAALTAAVGFGVMMYHEHNVAERKLGIAEERSRVADSLLTINATELVRVDTVYKRDTLRLARVIARTDTLRDSLLVHLTDTLRVKEFVASTDSGIKVCRDMANDCAQFRVLATQRFALDSVKFRNALAAQSHPHWYDGRIAVGPAFNLAPNGKSSVGVSVQISLLRFP